MLVIMALLGLAVWFGTELVVESTFFHPLRQWVGGRHSALRTAELKAYYGGDMRRAMIDLLSGEYEPPKAIRTRLFEWLTKLVSCKLCTGTWVGLLVAAFAPPLVSTPVVGWVLTGLALTAMAQLVLIGHSAVVAWIHLMQHASKENDL